MRKVLFGLLLLSLAACMKDNETELYPIYMLKVKCIDCVIDIVDYPTVDYPIKSIEVRGTAELPYTYIPEKIEFTIWSNVQNDDALVIFSGKNYPVKTLYSGVLKSDSKEPNIVNQPLPQSR